MSVLAIVLVVVGVALAGSLDGWSGAPLALALQYLGISLLLLATVGVAPAAVAIVVACGVIGVLVTSSAGSFPPTRRGLLTWLSDAFQLRWFDLSVTAVAMVGALGLASTRSVFGGSADAVVDILIFTGLLYCLVGRPARIACGLLFLASAGSVALQEAEQPLARIDGLLLAIVPLSLALALTYLRAIEEQRSPARRTVAATGSSAEEPALVAAADDSTATDVFAVGLAALGGLALVVATRADLATAALATTVTAVVLSWGLVRPSGSGASIRSVQRYLVWMLLAGSGLLLSGTFDQMYEQQAVSGILAPAAALFVVGAGIFVAALPFSLWLPALCDEAPIGASLVVALLGCAMMATLDGTVGSSPFLTNDAPLRGVLGTGGGLAAIASSFFALGERRPGRALAFLISAGADFSLAGLVSNSSNALAPAIWLLGAQAFAGSLALAGLCSVGCCGSSHEKSDGSTLDGLIWRRPLLGWSLVVGLLSLVGMPLTAGFVGRWETIETAGWHIGGLAVGMLIASVFGGLAVLRSFRAIFEATDRPREPIRTVDVAAVLIAVVLVIGGIYPWPIMAMLR